MCSTEYHTPGATRACSAGTPVDPQATGNVGPTGTCTSLHGRCPLQPRPIVPSCGPHTCDGDGAAPRVPQSAHPGVVPNSAAPGPRRRTGSARRLGACGATACGRRGCRPVNSRGREGGRPGGHRTPGDRAGHHPTVSRVGRQNFVPPL